MKKMMLIAMVFALAFSAYAQNCCVEDSVCYLTEGSQCAGALHEGECTKDDACYAVHECMLGDISACEELGASGIKECGADSIYSSCVITDQDYLLSIDADMDRDPDSTDCAPYNPGLNWIAGCEMLAPLAGFVNMLKILLIAALLYLIWKIFTLCRRKPGKKQGMKARKRSARKKPKKAAGRKKAAKGRKAGKKAKRKKKR